MAENRLIKLLLLYVAGTVFAMWPGQVFPFTSEPPGVHVVEIQWQPHDMRKLTETRFQVSGNDPFVVSSELHEQVGRVKGFLLQFFLLPKVKEHHLQCYWETDGQTFSEINSFHFIVTGEQQRHQVFIPAYFFDTLKPIRRIRFDLDSHIDAVLGVESLAIVETMQPALLAYIPESTGTPKVDGHALLAPHVHVRKPGSIQANAWLLHDIEPVGQGRFRISGKDPYLESPPLDIRTAQVKGVYYKLVNTSCNTPCKMQFFWKSYVLDYQSERRPFNERESYWFWMDCTDGVGEVYLPLGELDPKDLLKAIRLDFGSCQDMEFAIEQFAFVTQDDLAMRSHLPGQIAYRNMAAIPVAKKSGKYVIHWLELLFIDQAFWTAYFSFIAVACLGLGCLVFRKKGCAGKRH